MSSPFERHEGLVDQLRTMLKQEDTTYKYESFFPSCVAGDSSYKYDDLDAVWREKICQWSYNVVDHFELSREVVAYSLCLFDRFMATRGNKCTGNVALLVSLTTLHIAIKLHDCKKIRISTLASLSRGQFTEAHIEQMEWQVLSALGWKLHPPTQYAFISILLTFLPAYTPISARKAIDELSRYQTELAVCDSFFVGCKASIVAFASILNVLEEISVVHLSMGVRECFLSEIHSVTGLHPHSPEVVAAQKRLRVMFTGSRVKNVDPTPLSASPTSTTTTWMEVDETAPSPSVLCGTRPRTNSFGDSTGNFRFSPMGRRRCTVGSNAAPLVGRTNHRNRFSTSPSMTGTQ